MARATSPNDAALLDTLERAFARHAGGDERIDVPDLQRALGLRSTFLAQRVLTAFDRDGNGVITKDGFLTGVRALVFGTAREKLDFAFRLHDYDADGFLDRDDLQRMIAVSLAESDVSERVSQPPSTLASEVLAAADANGDGRISLDELEAVVTKRPELLDRMTRSEAIWIAPNEELLLLVDERAKRSPGRVRRWLENHTARIAWLTVFVLANVGVLAWSMAYGRTHDTPNVPMRLGRAVGACLDLDGGLVLLPMMRRLLTKLRATWVVEVLPVDDAIAFHRLVGHTLFALAVTHAAAFTLAYASGHGASVGRWHVFATSRGATGGALLAVFTVMWFFSLDFVRRARRFEVFYFTHLLYVAWLGLAIAHGPRFLLFSGVPIVGFVIEQLARLRKRRPRARIVSTWPLRSGVTRLELEKPAGFRFSPGDYVFLRIPEIARHEWHPFTISSAPEQPTLTFHARSLGNWTAALRRRIEDRPREAEDGLVAYVDGPYGSPSGHIFRSRFAVMIGAGIGVTPFASVLESIVLGSPKSLEKVHFVWLNRDQYSFEWFRGLLSRLEEKDDRGLLDIHLCMTGARTGVTTFGLELAREIMHASGRSDLVTGLRTKTHFGQPDWEALLGGILREHAPHAVDVYFCGPHGLANKLEPICRRLGMRFREERF